MIGRHRLQLLDVSFMAPLGAFYEQEVRKWLIGHPGRCVTIYQIEKLFNAAFTRAATIQTAIKGFEKTGIYPFNSNDHLFAPSDTTERPVDDMSVQQERELQPSTSSSDATPKLEPQPSTSSCDATPNLEPQPSTSSCDATPNVEPQPSTSSCDATPNVEPQPSTSSCDATPNVEPQPSTSSCDATPNVEPQPFM
ncbi:hypothetical protein JTB14_020002 [Gonioctena quinquepunctata]|nr:hypothetical protein JTB14_020002 [Gonioctena quinquepunctata]